MVRLTRVCARTQRARSFFRRGRKTSGLIEFGGRKALLEKLPRTHTPEGSLVLTVSISPESVLPEIRALSIRWATTSQRLDARVK